MIFRAISSFNFKNKNICIIKHCTKCKVIKKHICELEENIGQSCFFLCKTKDYFKLGS